MQTNVLILLSTIIILSCSAPIEKVQGNNKQLNKLYVNSCFDSQPLLKGQALGTTITRESKHNNFLRYSVNSDSTFVFSCGKREKEFFITEFDCSETFNLPDVIYENNSLICLVEKGGSNSWLNTFVDFRSDTLIKDVAWAVDTIRNRYVGLYISPKDELNFYVHNFTFSPSNKNDTLPTKFTRADCYSAPSLSILNVYLTDFSLHYELRTHKEIVTDSIPLLK